jgi:DNA-binding MarR family transcriptional regulator
MLLSPIQVKVLTAIRDLPGAPSAIQIANYLEATEENVISLIEELELGGYVETQTGFANGVGFGILWTWLTFRGNAALNKR